MSNFGAKPINIKHKLLLRILNLHKCACELLADDHILDRFDLLNRFKLTSTYIHLSNQAGWSLLCCVSAGTAICCQPDYALMASVFMYQRLSRSRLSYSCDAADVYTA